MKTFNKFYFRQNKSNACLLNHQMKEYTLERTQILPISIERAWDFFSSPKNLKLITPDYMDFRITSELPDKMYEGQNISYVVKPLLGIPLKWTTLIPKVVEGKYFADTQTKGPYKLWFHEHSFSLNDNNEVEMTDKVTYALPLGILGQLAHAIFVRRQLEGIFDYRFNKVEELIRENVL